MDLQITNVDPVTGVVTLGIPLVPRKLTGLSKLAQIVTLQILKNPGQDVLAPAEGTGFRSLIGQYNFVSVEEIRGVVVQRIRFVESQILASQLPGVGTPSERLKELKLQDMAFNDTTRELVVRIRVLNESGQDTDVIV